MAPFGKSFLKARLKNRTKDAEPVVGKEIQVTVCNEEKVVCGVTKHTTCADMIQALLEDHKSIPESKRLLHGEPKDFCLVERWKGFERALPPLTRILRLWYAWGDQRPFIQFILVKTSDFVPQPTKKGGKSKGTKPKRWEHSRAQYTQSLPVEKQKRIVKKAFRKLEKLHKDSMSSPGAEEIDRMVQLILDQDHTIREQIKHMRELDLEIEQFDLQEQKKEAESESLVAQACGVSVEAHGDSAAQLQEYLFTSDGVEQLELQVQRHQELILQLSQDIDTELRRANFPLSQYENSEQEGAAAASWIPVETDESFYTAELERLQDELQHSLFTGVSLHNQSAEIDKQLKYCDAMLLSKDEECWQLAAHLSSLQIEDRGEEEHPSPVPLKSETQCSISQTVTQCSVSQTVKLKHSLSPLDITDTDSDTGISSTHSQDSLSPCLDFPPPLDTDV
uniref:ras association domain-containing protein 9 n=1 Tax=Scatophagus argus TaxID=75038 RepID=UPI001ED803A2|nr:ras association domain-containing protein 9 [Scatophagus argus]